MVDETTATGTASTDTSTAPNGQAQPPAPQGQTPAVDLEKELQKIRSAAGREAAAARAAAQQAAAEAAALRQQLRSIQVGGMDELEKAKFERDEAWQAAQALQAQLQTTQTLSQKERDIAELQQEYGVPRSELEEATDYADAVRRARAWEKAQRDALIEAEIAKRTRKAEANAVDIGGGKPHNSDDFGEKLKEARKTGSAYELARLLTKARKGS